MKKSSMSGLDMAMKSFKVDGRSKVALRGETSL